MVRINPADGSVVSRFAAPFDINFGGLAVDPTTGNLWIGSSQDNRVAEVTTAGALVRTKDLAPESISNEISGLVFKTPTQLIASSTRGVVYFKLDPPLSDSSTAAGPAPAADGSTNFFPTRDTSSIPSSVAVAPTAVSVDGTDRAAAGVGSSSAVGGLDDDTVFGDAGLWRGGGRNGLFGMGGHPTMALRAERLIDWSGTFDNKSVATRPSPWLREFLLDLAEPDGTLDPNSEIHVVIPG